MDPKFELVEIENNTSFKSFNGQCALFQDDHGWHYHPEYELTYIVSGEGLRFVGDNIQQFGPGDLVFIGPDIPHCWTNDDNDTSDPTRNNLLVLQFNPEFLGTEFLSSPDALALNELFILAQRGLSFHGEHAEDIKHAMQTILEKTGLPRLSAFLHLLHTMTQCTDYEHLISELYIADNSMFHSARMAKVMDYVRKNIGSDIIQPEVAELVNMTPQGFSRFFRATTGRTFVSFVNVMRIMNACRMLTNTNLDIIDIAFECGYANLSNFNRRFSELKNTTPTDYRKQHGKLT
jgi:AraC-like DNA-binding protein